MRKRRGRSRPKDVKVAQKGCFLVVFGCFLHRIRVVLARVRTVDSCQWSGIGREWAMRKKDREVARMRLDVEMRSYRAAGRAKNPTNELLRAVRQALRVPVAEIAEKMGVNRSAIFDLEAGERKNTIRLKSMSRMAGAMGCKVVY